MLENSFLKERKLKLWNEKKMDYPKIINGVKYFPYIKAIF